MWATPITSRDSQGLPAASAARGDGGDDGGLSTGTAVGIAVGVTGGVLLIALVVISFLVVRYRRWYQYYKQEQRSGQRGSPGSPMGVGGMGQEYGTTPAANAAVQYGTEHPSRCGGDLCGCWCNCTVLGWPAAGGGRWDKCSRSPTLPSVAMVSREASMPNSDQAGQAAAVDAAAALLAAQEGPGPNVGHPLCSQQCATVSLALSGSGPSMRNLARQLVLLQQHEQARVARGGVVNVRPTTPQSGFVQQAGRTYASVGAHTEELSTLAAAAASTQGASAGAAADVVPGLPRFPSAPSAPLLPLALPQQPQHQQQQSCHQVVNGADAARGAGDQHHGRAAGLRHPHGPSAPGSGACSVATVDVGAAPCGARSLAAAGSDVELRGTAFASCRRLLGLSPVAAGTSSGSTVCIVGQAMAA